uniref:Uncharacterized protein ORF Bo1 n=1 Tax=Bovine herpesvirus 4 TaxID=10385 RepID=G1EUN7_BHV4|nr:hypothetical protein [Bovine gammaherpesvirus 4]
MEGDGFMFTF